MFHILHGGTTCGYQLVFRGIFIIERFAVIGKKYVLHAKIFQQFFQVADVGRRNHAGEDVEHFIGLFMFRNSFHGSQHGVMETFGVATAIAGG